MRLYQKAHFSGAIYKNSNEKVTALAKTRQRRQDTCGSPPNCFVKQPKCTQVEGADTVMQSSTLFRSFTPDSADMEGTEVRD